MQFLSLEPFVPSGADFEASKQFFQELGFSIRSGSPTQSRSKRPTGKVDSVSDFQSWMLGFFKTYW